VERLGVPLSTPNEVAIYQVAARLRRDGCVVTLSGEGADEIFGGYDGPLRAAAAYERGAWGGHERASHPGEFQLLDAAWIPPSAKAGVLDEALWRGVEQDAELTAWYRGAFDECAAGAAPDLTGDGLAAHLRFLRRVNLSGLLARLDTATMLAGVEGRTPFADAEVAGLADTLPTGLKFDEAVAGVAGTKIVLRRAFAGRVPREVVERPKASFPLPFQAWVEDQAGVLLDSALAREMFTEAARVTVAARAGELWRLSWPMVNLALWGRRF
jgi:asparagine synthase (glutamine-hydrolysing)